MKRIYLFVLLIVFLAYCSKQEWLLEPSPHDLHFKKLANTWDEGIPLGNGLLGELVWVKEGRLRFSLDRSDLWDLRPMKNLSDSSLTYKWVYDQWKNKKYHLVQEKLDIPYDQRPAPSKIPAGALEFDVSSLGKVLSVHLYTRTGICEVTWENGARMTTFVQAGNKVGWYRFEGVDNKVQTEIIAPPYSLESDSGDQDPITGQDLRRLGYPKGTIKKSDHSMTYDQEGWGGFHYQISVQWKQKKDVLEGCWSISSHYPDKKQKPEAIESVKTNFISGYTEALQHQKRWWQDYWAKSSICIPDSVLEKQYYLEMYKFGSAARKGASPISLQAVWTADNGRLPPWKGDYHHDLNTQLSYWAAYKGNHLEVEEGFLDWLWDRKPVFEKYTRAYFETDGLNMPGVTTLEGEPMGGWIQYSMGPTISSWISQHFYLHWKYSMDRDFLREKAYPWIRAVAVYLNKISAKDKDGKRKLPLSSSPEIHDNSREAWFEKTTNFDLALIRFIYSKAAELANELGKTWEAEEWSKILSEWPDFAVSDTKGLLVAPGEILQESHRHFSHLMAIHPLGLIDHKNGNNDREIIKISLSYLDSLGPDWWCGYSYSWLGNMKARAIDGEGAAQALRIFSECFCLPNSFHANGDQSRTGKSKYTYRPFTLEGNFAFASGIQEMLLQSHTGIILVFPAIPESWENVSFDKLRAEGAFLVSATKKNKKIHEIKIHCEKGGTLRFYNPFANEKVKISGIKIPKEQLKAPIIEIETTPGMDVVIIASYGH